MASGASKLAQPLRPGSLWASFSGSCCACCCCCCSARCPCWPHSVPAAACTRLAGCCSFDSRLLNSDGSVLLPPLWLPALLALLLTLPLLQPDPADSPTMAPVCGHSSTRQLLLSNSSGRPPPSALRWKPLLAAAGEGGAQPAHSAASASQPALPALLAPADSSPGTPLTDWVTGNHWKHGPAVSVAVAGTTRVRRRGPEHRSAQQAQNSTGPVLTQLLHRPLVVGALPRPAARARVRTTVRTRTPVCSRRKPQSQSRQEAALPTARQRVCMPCREPCRLTGRPWLTCRWRPGTGRPVRSAPPASCAGLGGDSAVRRS